MNISKLTNVLSKMRSSKPRTLFEYLNSFGSSDLTFNANGISNELEIWKRCQMHELNCINQRLPTNSFEELITLTKQGKLWHYPIDNEQGMEAEQAVPFEDHVFFDEQIEKFPRNEEIRQFMDYVVMGLSNNPWITVDRKRTIIDWYLKYFLDHEETYKTVGYSFERVMDEPYKSEKTKP